MCCSDLATTPRGVCARMTACCVALLLLLLLQEGLMCSSPAALHKFRVTMHDVELENLVRGCVAVHDV